MTTTQMLLIIIVALLTTFIVLVTFLIFRLIRKSSFYFRNIFSNFDLTLKKHFYMANFYDEVYDFLSELEVRNDIRLSEEAKQLLILPLIEFQRINHRNRDSYRYNRQEFRYDLDSWRDSIVKIVENVKYEPARFDRYENDLRNDERTSMSVIKAFANKFCNIPPFCGEK